jgi:O-antigen/teichoic acid export membrane protein
LKNFTTTSLRTKNVKKQIIFSILIKGIGFFLNYLVISVTLDFLGKELYGIWIVMLSFLQWINLFDIGIGNGLRNKLTESLSKGNNDEAREFITTGYVMMTIVGSLLILFIYMFLPFINWNIIFNSDLLSNSKFKILLMIFFTTIILNFILNLITSILNAFQKSASIGGISILANILFLATISILGEKINNDIVSIMLLFGVSSIASSLIYTFIFFLSHREFIPQKAFFNKKFSKKILTLGGDFFIIQIAVLLIFTVDNFIIIQLLGPGQVSEYNIMFKLFSIFTISFNIILTPLWSAFTEAFVKKDILWIRKIIRFLNYTMIPIVILIAFMIKFHTAALNLWLSNSVQIQPEISFVISLALFTVISIWNNIYAYFLNGIGSTKLQIRTAVVGAFANVPLAIFFVKEMNLGLTGIVLSMCSSLIFFSILGPIETFKILKKESVKCE